MILKRLLKSNWRKDKNAGQGHAAAAEASQWSGDADPAKRRQACKQTRDPALLLRVLRDDGDAGVRELAAARLRHLLCGGETGGPALEERRRVLGELDDSQVAAHLAREAREPELRLAALERVDDPETLAECCLQDAVAAVRLAAVERLNDKSALERVGRLIGRRDKNVYREVRHKLKAITEREREPARIRAEAQGLCERAERLGRTGTWSQDKAVMELLVQQWGELGAAVPRELGSRFEAAREAFLAAWQAYREANLARIQEEEAKERLRADKQALLERLAALEAEVDADDLEDRLAALSEARTALGSLPEAEERGLERQWRETERRLRDALERRRALRQRGRRLQRLIAEAEAWMGQSHPLEHQRLRQWRKHGRELAALAPDDALAGAFAELGERLQGRLDKQIAHAREKLEHLPERLWLLEQELEQGVLRQATALHQSIQADLQLLRACDIRDAHIGALEQRARRLLPQLRELQSWRKWGTDQHRIELAEAMERLIGEEGPLDELTNRIQALQEQWKALDRGGSPVNESLWQRFHQAADQAYERCKPYLEEQAREREANLAARESICSELETFLEQVDWERVDWKKAVQAERQTRTAWAAAGAVDPRRRKSLDKRYRAAMKRLDTRLAEERARNRAHKQDLIARARVLAEESDPERATAEVRRLQQAWHTTVASKRQQENHLWESFRAACDQVFDRRRAAHQNQQQELEANAEACRQVCAELETAAAAGESAEGLQQAWHALRARWEACRTRDVPRRDAPALHKRWDAAEGAATRRVQELRRAAEREQLDRLRARAALCLELEAALATGSAGDAGAWEARWQALPVPADADRAALGEGRWRAALEAVADPARWAAREAQRAADGERRAELCLKMEVLAGIDSPPEASQERLAFQVSRLAGRLAQGERDPLLEAPQVEADWYLAGPGPAADAARLEGRFQRALAAALGGTAEPAREPAVGVGA